MTSSSTTTPSCTTRIKKLPPLLINQLAAGEIVTRPAAVVKELLENAIDAGANQIQIKVTGGGMRMIEVSDNGCGIHPDDMVMAVTRHATSKIADVANLQGIRTLGFRGEALASTAAVSRLTLSSSHDDSGIGRQLSVSGVLEDTPIMMPIVHDRGTTVLVKDLYFNVPARRGNLKSVATEFGHIESVVREVALAYADISLTLYHDHKKRLVLPASSNSNNNSNSNGPINGIRDDDPSAHALDGHSAEPLASNLGAQDMSSEVTRLPLSRLEQALGMSLRIGSVPLMVDLAVLTDSHTDLTVNEPLGSAESEPRLTSPPSLSPQIEGWLWLRESSSSLPKLIYVNGRLIKDQVIASHLRQTLQRAIRGLPALNIGYALYFHLPAHWLNVNVHPSKQRIKIFTLANIMAHLDYAVTSAMNRAVGSLTQSVSSPSDPLTTHRSHQRSHLGLEDDTSYLSGLSDEDNQRQINSQVAEGQQSYQLARPTAALGSVAASEGASTESVGNTHIPRLDDKDTWAKADLAKDLARERLEVGVGVGKEGEVGEVGEGGEGGKNGRVRIYPQALQLLQVIPTSDELKSSEEQWVLLLYWRDHHYLVRLEYFLRGLNPSLEWSAHQPLSLIQIEQELQAYLNGKDRSQSDRLQTLLAHIQRSAEAIMDSQQLVKLMLRLPNQNGE